ncbi:sugar-specific transcriptional regulator TrmB [Methanolobus sp. ZRKC3]|uniref:HVO_A0114 family putative DNA-binding protein n=1 Tax=Methanolobus sp. ZRKC3 TaxID=3125786 RepID=UPI00324ED920
MTEDSIEELLRWIISVDRRLILMQYMKKHTIAKASEIAHETHRSTQNISRALKELEERGLIECMTPSKITWKKYVLTDMGKAVLEKMDGTYL